jgi:3-oxoacyl-[acyl-carrier-protein] synthase II
MHLFLELGHYLWGDDYRPLWARHEQGGGIITGSVGAFLILEAKSHAQARGAKTYARIADVLADRCGRNPGDAAKNALEQFGQLRDRIEPGSLPLISGSCGAEPITSEECRFLEQLAEAGFDPSVRSVGSMLGHSVEAQFPASLALAAIAASKNSFFEPFADCAFEKPFEGSPDQILVTAWGHWRGEGLALVEVIH